MFNDFKIRTKVLLYMLKHSNYYSEENIKKIKILYFKKLIPKFIFNIIYFAKLFLNNLGNNKSYINLDTPFVHDIKKVNNWVCDYFLG